MDSMRHLSTSLPTTRRRQDQPELLADFKAAALSVTNLYKTAAASQDRARAAGYQDAVDDLLAFLDRENLGLMDGEGWRVRRWATERLVDDGGMWKQDAGSDDDGEGGGGVGGETVRSSSPEVQRKPVPASTPTPTPTLVVSSSELTDETSTRRTVGSEPPAAQLPTQDMFTFRSSHAIYPSNHDRETNNTMDLDTTSSTPTSTSTSTQHSNISTEVRIIPRQHGNNNRARHTNHNRQRGNLSLGVSTGAGSKRKLPYPEFFDISGSGFDGGSAGPGRDGMDFGGGAGRGGGKRGRHV